MKAYLKGPIVQYTWLIAVGSLPKKITWVPRKLKDRFSTFCWSWWQRYPLVIFLFGPIWCWNENLLFYPNLPISKRIFNPMSLISPDSSSLMGLWRQPKRMNEDSYRAEERNDEEPLR